MDPYCIDEEPIQNFNLKPDTLNVSFIQVCTNFGIYTQLAHIYQLLQMRKFAGMLNFQSSKNLHNNSSANFKFIEYV